MKVSFNFGKSNFILKFSLPHLYNISCQMMLSPWSWLNHTFLLISLNLLFAIFSHRFVYRWALWRVFKMFVNDKNHISSLLPKGELQEDAGDDEQLILWSWSCTSSSSSSSSSSLTIRTFPRCTVCLRSLLLSQQQSSLLLLFVDFSLLFFFSLLDGQSAIRWSTDLQWWQRLGCGPKVHFAAMWFANSPQL